MFEFVSDALNLKQMGSIDPGAQSVLSTDSRVASSKSLMPDVANESLPLTGGTLERVGMSGVELVLRLRDASGEIFRTPARADAAVSLTVHDLAGRKVASLLDSAWKPAGRHEVAVDTRGWAPGVYYYRLATPGASSTHRMVVLK